MIKKSKRRVLKLGGSLLTMPDVAEHVQQWLQRQPPAQTFMVVGGGEVVEAVRELDKIHSFDPHWCHWLCVDLLSHTADLARQIFPQAAWIATNEELLQSLKNQRGEAALQIIYVTAFYSQAVSQAQLPDGAVLAVKLPDTWATTTDSIAAFLAKSIVADELVLLKSSGEDQVQNAPEAFETWRAAGLVDDAFPSIAVGIPRVRLVNLRADRSSEVGRAG